MDPVMSLTFTFSPFVNHSRQSKFRLCTLFFAVFSFTLHIRNTKLFISRLLYHIAIAADEFFQQSEVFRVTNVNKYASKIIAPSPRSSFKNRSDLDHNFVFVSNSLKLKGCA